jgi:hypothetical protein
LGRINSGRPIEEWAEEFEVSYELIRYRIKICGAAHLYKLRNGRREDPSNQSREALKCFSICAQPSPKVHCYLPAFFTAAQHFRFGLTDWEPARIPVLPA